MELDSVYLCCELFPVERISAVSHHNESISENRARNREREREKGRMCGFSWESEPCPAFSSTDAGDDEKKNSYSKEWIYLLCKASPAKGEGKKKNSHRPKMAWFSWIVPLKSQVISFTEEEEEQGEKRASWQGIIILSFPMLTERRALLGGVPLNGSFLENALVGIPVPIFFPFSLYSFLSRASGFYKDSGLRRRQTSTDTYRWPNSSGKPMAKDTQLQFWISYKKRPQVVDLITICVTNLAELSRVKRNRTLNLAACILCVCVWFGFLVVVVVSWEMKKGKGGLYCHEREKVCLGNLQK